MHMDVRKESAVEFLQAIVAHFKALSVTIEPLLTKRFIQTCLHE